MDAWHVGSKLAFFNLFNMGAWSLSLSFDVVWLVAGKHHGD